MDGNISVRYLQEYIRKKDYKPELLKDYFLKLSEEVVDPEDIEMLEDLIVAATNEAFRQMEEASAEAMSKLTGGLGALGGGLGGGLPF